MRRWRQSGTALLFGLAVATAGGCKPPGRGSVSEVKTLDNFAAGSRVRTNSCETQSPVNGPIFLENRIWMGGKRVFRPGYTPKPNESGRRYEDLSAGEQLNYDTAKRSIETVGKPTQIAMLSMGAIVDIISRDEVLKRCTTALRAEGAEKTGSTELEYVTACVTFEKVKGGSRLSVNLIADAKEIAHATTRTIASFPVQLFPRMAGADPEMQAAGGVYQLTQGEATEIAMVKEQVAVRFWWDMAKSTLFSLSSMEGVLGTGSAQTIAANVSNLENRHVTVDQAKLDDVLKGVSFIYKNEQLGPDGLTSEMRATRFRRAVDLVSTELYDSLKCHPFGAYPSDDDVAQLNAGKISRDEFIKNVDNTRRVVDVFFPNTAKIYGQFMEKLEQVSLAMAKQSDYSEYLDAGAGLALADTGGLLEALFGASAGNAGQTQAVAPVAETGNRSKAPVAAVKKPPAQGAGLGALLAMAMQGGKNAPKSPDTINPKPKQGKQGDVSDNGA